MCCWCPGLLRRSLSVSSTSGRRFRLGRRESRRDTLSSTSTFNVDSYSFDSFLPTQVPQVGQKHFLDLHVMCPFLPPPFSAFHGIWNSLSQAIPDLDARIRNVQLLVEDLPWAHQPLLLALASLCGTIAPPKHSLPPPPPGRRRPAPKTSNDINSAAFLTEGVTIIDETELEAPEDIGVVGGVAVRDAAEAMAPALLRYPPPAVGGGGEGAGAAAGAARRLDWEEEIAAAAVVELIFTEQRRVLAGMRAEQKRR